VGRDNISASSSDKFVKFVGATRSCERLHRHIKGRIVGINPRLVAYATTLLLSGCVGQALQEGLHAYSGQPASALFSKLGLPTAEQTIAALLQLAPRQRPPEVDK